MKKNNEQLNENNNNENVNQFQPNGYAKFYFSDKVYEKFLEDIGQLLSDKQKCWIFFFLFFIIFYSKNENNGIYFSNIFNIIKFIKQIILIKKLYSFNKFWKLFLMIENWFKKML